MYEALVNQLLPIEALFVGTRGVYAVYVRFISINEQNERVRFVEKLKVN